MTTRRTDGKTRTRNHRRTLLAGLAISFVLHGVVLGRRTAPIPVQAPASEDRPEEQARFDTPALELVRLEIEEPVKPVVQEVMAMTPAVEPSVADPAQDPAGAAAREPRIALSMRPDFSALHRMTAFALEPVPATRAEAAQPGEDEEDEGRNFWERLGISTGRGGGACPIPRRPGSNQAG